jgi:hypothetical protein
MRKQNVFQIDMNLKIYWDDNLTFIVPSDINIFQLTIKGKSVYRVLYPQN